MKTTEMKKNIEKIKGINKEYNKLLNKERKLINVICKEINNIDIKLDDDEIIYATSIAFDNVVEGKIVELRIEDGYLTIMFMPEPYAEVYELEISDFYDIIGIGIDIIDVLDKHYE